MFDLIKALLDAFRDYVNFFPPRLYTFPPPPWVTAQEWLWPVCGELGWAIDTAKILNHHRKLKITCLPPPSSLNNGVLLKITNLAYLQHFLSRENVIRRGLGNWTRHRPSRTEIHTMRMRERAYFFLSFPNLFYFNGPMTDTPSKRRVDPAWLLTDEITHSFSGQHRMTKPHLDKHTCSQKRTALPGA